MRKTIITFLAFCFVKLTAFAQPGAIDATFNPGEELTDYYYIYITSIQADGKIIVGGVFTSFSGTQRNCIARLNEDGFLDLGFDPGTGFNHIVRSTSIQADGKIIVGGKFTSFNGTPRNHIARLNEDGSLDNSFDPGSGFNSSVRSISFNQTVKLLWEDYLPPLTEHPETILPV